MRLTIKDAAFVNRVVADDSIYPYITDDYADEELKAVMGTMLLSNQAYYLLSPNEYSLFLLIPRSMTIYEVHTMILPEGRGRAGIRAGVEGAHWMFENTTCEKLVSDVPEDCPSALRYAISVGFNIEGVCTKSIRRNGRLLDQTVVGLEKGKLWPQQ